jgi:hypothetical protein
MAEESQIVLVDQIEPLILEIRGQKVLLDRDLAALYGVPTKRLNEQVRRNRERFPEDFMLQLTKEEAESLRSQNATASKRNVRYQPYAFTEHGTIMAAMLLNSPRAVEVSVFVVRAFVKLRRFVLAHKELAAKLDQLEKKVGGHDDAIRQLMAAIRQLMAPPQPSPKHGRIGFRAPVPEEERTEEGKVRNRVSFAIFSEAKGQLERFRSLRRHMAPYCSRLVGQ